MKLSSNFVEVIKNFASINPGLVFKPGNVLRTISTSKNVLAQAEVDESFDREFGIYDLNRMLALLSLNKAHPEVVIEDDSLVFTGLAGKGKIRQRFSSTNLIMAPPEKIKLDVGKYEVNLELKQEVFDWIFNVSSILKCPHTVIRGVPDQKITFNAMGPKDIVDTAFVTLETVADRKFEVILKNEYIKVIPGAYDVSISKTGFALFSHKVKKLQYWIAIESDSSFE